MSVIAESDGEGGLSHPLGAGWSMALDGEELTLTDEDGSFILQRVGAEKHLAYSEEELNGATLYNIWENDEGCSPLWVLEAISFSNGSYSFTPCNTGILETGSYSVLDSGVLSLGGAEFLKRISYDESIEGYAICWEDSEAAALACESAGNEYEFTSLSAAESFQQAQNAP